MKRRYTNALVFNFFFDLTFCSSSGLSSVVNDHFVYGSFTAVGLLSISHDNCRTERAFT